MSEQLTTFYIGSELYGIEVMKVQEVTGTQHTMAVPLSPKFVRGLVNLRGQIATAIDLRQLFTLEAPTTQNEMSVVCKVDHHLVSLLVDSIGDVLEFKEADFENVPETVPLSIRRFLKGVYKMENALLSVLDIDLLSKELSDTKTETH